MTTPSTGGSLMATSALLSPIGPTTSTGSMTFSLITSFQPTPFVLNKVKSGVLILALAPIAFTRFLALPFLVGALLDQAALSFSRFSDVTDVAIKWATRNVNSNPHIAELIEIKKVEDKEKALCVEGFHEGGARINICKEFFESLEEVGLNPKTS